MNEQSLIQRIWYEAFKRMLQLCVVPFCSMRHWGIENIPAEGGVLVVSNHESFLDPVLVGTGVRRGMTYLARSSLFRNILFGTVIRSIDAIPIDREGLGLAGIKESLRRLKRGGMVVIFPEGTRTPDGEIQPFRAGFTMLAVRSKAAILPVAIEGAFQAWPRRQKLPSRSTIHVRYGRPILPEEARQMNDEELLAEVERRVRQCREQLREHPAFRSRRRG